MTATPASDIPVANFKLPPGFKAEVWATGIPGGRAMARGDSGKIYIGTRAIGRVYEVTDNGSTRTSRVVVDKLNQPGGVAIRNGSLYVIAIDKALRYDGIEKNPTVTPVDMTAVFKLPKEQHHNWKYIAFGPDGKLYVPFGAPCNICVPPTDEYAQIRRYNADGSGMEVIATRHAQHAGLRLASGDQASCGSPITAATGWATTTPEDELNRMTKTGLNFGFPYCHANGVADKDIKKANPCEGVTLPVTTMGPHAAVMGVHFYTGNMFPAEYRNVMFVARKGSWNRTKKYGYDVVTVRTDADGKNPKVEPFMTGFLDPNTDAFSGRPDLHAAAARRLAARVRRTTGCHLSHHVWALNAVRG